MSRRDREAIYAMQRMIGLRTADEIRAAERLVSDEELALFRERFTEAMKAGSRPAVLPPLEARARWRRGRAAVTALVIFALGAGAGLLSAWLAAR